MSIVKSFFLIKHLKEIVHLTKELATPTKSSLNTYSNSRSLNVTLSILHLYSWQMWKPVIGTTIVLLHDLYFVPKNQNPVSSTKLNPTFGWIKRVFWCSEHYKRNNLQQCLLKHSRFAMGEEMCYRLQCFHRYSLPSVTFLNILKLPNTDWPSFSSSLYLHNLIWNILLFCDRNWLYSV